MPAGDSSARPYTKRVRKARNAEEKAFYSTMEKGKERGRKFGRDLERREVESGLGQYSRPFRTVYEKGKKPLPQRYDPDTGGYIPQYRKGGAVRNYAK